MLLAQINRDSQGMAEFPGGGMEAQHVTLCLTEAVTVADGDNLENMEGVSLQAVTLADGSTAYIQHNSKDGKLIDGQVIQLEDGSAAYVQHVPMPKSRDSLRLEDGQAVQLEDGTTAFIHHASKDSYDQSALQAVQLEDGTTAYIHHAVQVPQSDTILAIQADGTVAGLHTGDATIDPDTISALEQYAAKVSIDGSESVTGTGIIGENEQEKKMQVHERSHTGDRPYQCEHAGCGKAFATGYGLKSHFRTHTGEKPYRCSEDNCTKSFKTSGDLQKHIRTHTGERPFKCPFEGCGRSFTTSNIRKVHVRTHTGERPYYCTEPGCGRAFASATNYKNHVRIHTGLQEPPKLLPSVNISQADMQAIGNTITMVTQDGTPITVPAHDAVISSAGTHSVAMVTAEGTEGQQVAIVAQDLAAFHTASSEMGHQQQHSHHLVTTETRPLTLVATSNGTQIAVQLGEQPSLEEAIRIASRIQQGETPGLDD
ncbi:zinc finger protein 143 [Octodon degus]|uniref:Zinc finger protein 143 n=1 Tax=Octodon degus TaxID=10160 RepID=A0A6P6ESK2_OCTDE|nr:zinc finger protein 143 [Octodon degus]